MVGWQFHPFQPTELYFHSPSGWGPGGCMILGPASMTQAPSIYVQVDDIPLALLNAERLGGTIVRQRTEIPGNHGFFGHFRAPDGNMFGVWAMK